MEITDTEYIIMHIIEFKIDLIVWKYNTHDIEVTVKQSLK